MERESFSKAQSLNQLSINNSCYGRCWVINPITEEKKSIKKDLLQEYLDNGWLRGRTLNESYRMTGGKYKKLSEEQKQENKLKRIEKQRETNKKKGKFFCYINKQTKERKFFTEKEKPDLTIWEPTWSKFNIEEIKKFLKEKKSWYQIAEYYGTTYWSIYSWYRDSKNRFI